MSILKGLLSAREGSYFKSEQEDDLSAYRRRRIREGAIKEHDVGRLLEGPTELFPISDTKLAEIHAQEARVSAPNRLSTVYGSTHGFGSTLEQYTVMTCGTRKRGRPQDGPFKHDTGKGYVEFKKGHYHDGIYVKKKV